MKSISILVIDDYPEMVRFIAAVLELEGHTVFAADGPQHALELLREPHPKIDLLITDVNMPRFRGPQLALEARKSHPGLKTLYITGFLAAEDAIASEVGSGLAGYLAKPFRIKELLESVSLLFPPV